MTTPELLEALARECPSGVSFDPMAVRLLRQKLPLGDRQIEDLKATMFQLGNGLWFSREMVLDYESRLALERQAKEWLKEYGCFSVERLFGNFCHAFRHINTAEVCATFLRHLEFKVATWRKKGLFCFLSSPNLEDRLAKIAETIAEWLEEMDGTLTFHEIEQAMPHLTVEALGSIRLYFLPEVHEVEVGDVPCWRSTGAIPVPENFSEQLTTIIDTFDVLEESVTPTKLEFALNLFYKVRFCNEYGISDNNTFMRVCERYYSGSSKAFLNFKKQNLRKNISENQIKRVRSSNTCFKILGVPIGAELIFTKNNSVSCVVLDEVNQVEYEGKARSISSLATHLLGVSSANGFSYFTYDGETLWERRLRLERAVSRGEYKGNVASQQANASSVKGKIIGLDGRKLPTLTWRAFRSAGTNPRVAEWARRVASGESEENIARENHLKASTVKEIIVNRRRYFEICEKNGITPEGDASV